MRSHSIYGAQNLNQPALIHVSVTSQKHDYSFRHKFDRLSPARVGLTERHYVGRADGLTQLRSDLTEKVALAAANRCATSCVPGRKFNQHCRTCRGLMPGTWGADVHGLVLNATFRPASCLMGNMLINVDHSGL